MKITNKYMQNRTSLFFLIIVIISCHSILSQSISDKWKLIKSDDISKIFIEPSKIVEYGNEISVWSLEKLNEPKTLEKNDKVYSIKTHYLFNKIKKRYSEIGVIYYGAKGGIVNRSSKSSFNGGTTIFSTPISASSNAEIVYKEVISYLITGNVKEVEISSDSIKDEPAVANEKVVSNIVPKKKDSLAIVTNNTAMKSELPNKIAVNTDNLTMNISSNPKIKVSVKEIKNDRFSKLPEIIIAKNKYNLNNERAIKNAIFTDGNLYCFQVSSWKTKSYAKREVNKLIKRGYNAFIVSVKPKHKKNIWHRVRVGYFNSLKETRKVQREVR